MLRIFVFLDCPAPFRSSFEKEKRRAYSRKMPPKSVVFDCIASWEKQQQHLFYDFSLGQILSRPHVALTLLSISFSLTSCYHSDNIFQFFTTSRRNSRIISSSCVCCVCDSFGRRARSSVSITHWIFRLMAFFDHVFYRHLVLFPPFLLFFNISDIQRNSWQIIVDIKTHTHTDWERKNPVFLI